MSNTSSFSYKTQHNLDTLVAISDLAYMISLMKPNLIS